MTAPILVFGWGNPSRGDDALGPRFVEGIESLGLPEVECLTDFQLQVEHALDLQDRRLVLFVDASISAEAPFTITPLEPKAESSFTTHALEPAAVMQVYVDLHDTAPPPCQLLAIRGEHFGLGEALSPAAAEHLEKAIAWAKKWLAQATQFVTK